MEDYTRQIEHWADCDIVSDGCGRSYREPSSLSDSELWKRWNLEADIKAARKEWEENDRKHKKGER